MDIIAIQNIMYGVWAGSLTMTIIVGVRALTLKSHPVTPDDPPEQEREP